MKMLSKFLLLILCLLSVAFVSIITLLHTRYAQPILAYTLNSVSQYPIHFRQIDYSLKQPLYFRFHDLSIGHIQPEPLMIGQADVWFSTSLLSDKKLTIENLLLDSLSLQHGIPDLTVMNGLDVQRLAINALDFASDGLILRNAQIQLDNWKPNQQSAFNFQGQIQFSAEQLYWQGEAFDHVVIDGEIETDIARLYGISFDWKNSQISAQAEWTELEGWRLPQLTVSDLNLTTEEMRYITPHLSWLEELNQIITIERFDALNANIELPEININNLNLAITNLTWPSTLWQQKKTTLSFSADSASIDNIVFESPLADLRFTPNQISAHDLSFSTLGGFVSLAGHWQPKKLQLDTLTVNRIKWLLKPNWQQTLQLYLAPLQQVEIDKLSIKHSQLIDTESSTPFQMTGLNVHGRQLSLRHQEQWGLWQGKLHASVQNASLNYVLTNQAIVEMASMNGEWTIDQALFPLEQGILEVNGKLNLSEPSQPWQLTLTGDGIPTDLVFNWLNAQQLKYPLPITGLTEVSLSAQGLLGNRDSFNYSLEGELQLQPRDMATPLNAEQLWHYQESYVHTRPSNSTKQAINPLEISPIKITADRGRLTLQPITFLGEDFKASLEGSWDLATSASKKIDYQFTQGCNQITRSWLGSNYTTESTTDCD
ncbi:AsmA family protein [Vibrio sp. Of7-15]|uniref:AsmA family protein n=1 Tax=Vibrio sp. Of7-15 TaxID=2724879 RepID=UPI001EF297BF|nr:AsmA family protein [Vibrio sp. Of7-15]MCG7496767.1 AsmA family protein [Vibrio sp. Of7-15]